MHICLEAKLVSIIKPDGSNLSDYGPMSLHLQPAVVLAYAPILLGKLLCNLLPTVTLGLLPSIEFVASPCPSYSSLVACISFLFYKLNLILVFSSCISLSCFILHFLILTCIMSPNLASSANLMNVVLFCNLRDC